MLLRTKHQGLAIYATDPATGRTGDVEIRNFVTHRQLAVVIRDSRPIHQLCHHIHGALLGTSYSDLELRPRSLISLNARRVQLMIDPSVDIAGEPRRWGIPD